MARPGAANTLRVPAATPALPAAPTTGRQDRSPGPSTTPLSQAIDSSSRQASPNPQAGKDGESESSACQTGTKVTCRIPECDQPPFQFGAEYCSNQHRAEAVRRGLAPPCISCYLYPRVLYNFCGQSCNDRVSNGGPSLLPLEDRDPKFEEIRHLFDVSWKCTKKPKPKVTVIHKIVLGKNSMSNFFAYRKSVEDKRNFISQCRTPGNEGRRWFGTHRECQIGDNPNSMAYCANPRCSLCTLLKKSFKKGNTERPGAGISVSALSSKADESSTNGSSSGSLKAAVLATVVIGRGLKCLSERPDLSNPPNGYDSVLTEAGTSMAFDEVVVFSEDAIRPIWLVLYETDRSA
ncbi:hypothetical protein M407DRAFT_33130 [Tulasnella calospora MUT 4182]|uniref:PARP catalytic domain-containing protein n=1 Tax=Tulasnella calospora MUT 4182 TaxID=1051891 RepID=A0A0C3K746_9AGAM|nr:hypothetical protein M407DRAFT_33130 [Tulasnella calospora MUT 4182]